MNAECGRVGVERKEGPGSGRCNSTLTGGSARSGGCSGLWVRGAGERDVMDSSGLVSATTSAEGATTVGVGPGRRISGGGEASGTSCGEDEVGKLIENFARERSGQVEHMTMSLSSLNRLLEEPRSQNTYIPGLISFRNRNFLNVDVSLK